MATERATCPHCGQKGIITYRIDDSNVSVSYATCTKCGKRMKVKRGKGIFEVTPA